MKVETLLRPVQEYSSAFCSFSLGVFLYYFGNSFYLVKGITYPAILFFFIWGFFRLYEARRIKFYQQHIVVNPWYEMKLHKVPTLQKMDFYGKGFEWSSKHVARIEEANLQENENYLKINWKLRLSDYLSLLLQKKGLLKIEKIITYNHKLNPLRPAPKLGGRSELHGVGLLEGETDIFEDIAERNGHREIDGTTRAGKTTAARILIWQDVMKGMPVFVFDPKGDHDLYQSTYAAAKAAGREDDFVFFHLGFPGESAQYSPFSNSSRMTEVATIVTSSLPSSGEAVAFKEFSWRYVNNIQQCIASMGEQTTYKKILSYAQKIDGLFVKYCEFLSNKNKDILPNVQKLFNEFKGESSNNKFHMQWNEKTLQWLLTVQKIEAHKPEWLNENIKLLISLLESDKTHFQKLISILYPLLEKLTTGSINEILSPNFENYESNKKQLDFRNAIKENAIVYCGFDALSDTTVASAVSSAMMADLVSIAGEIYKHGTSPGLPSQYKEDIKSVSLYLDEGSDLLGKETIPLLNKAGGAGMMVTLLTQSSLADATAKLNDRAAATQVMANFNMRIIFRVRTKETAMSFCEQLGEAKYGQIMTFTGSTDSPDVDNDIDFVSSTQHRTAIKETPLLKPDQLINLPKGHAFLMSNGKLKKVRFPYTTIDTNLLPEEIQQISRKMKKSYFSNSNWYVDKWYLKNIDNETASNINTNKNVVDSIALDQANNMIASEIDLLDMQDGGL